MSTIKKGIKGIIFDMDGTIIKTEHIWQNVTREVIKKLGISHVTDEQAEKLEALTGASLPKASKIIKDVFDFDWSEEEILQQHIVFANDHFHKYPCEFIEGFEFFHKRLLEYAIPNGIATNAHHDNLTGIVKVNGFRRLFGEYIYSPRDVQERVKPDPALFLHTADKLKVRPEECVVFEDSVYGFEAAKAAGMKCIAVKNEKNKHLLDRVDQSIQSYDQAFEALKKV